MEAVNILPGKPLPLGTELNADGVNFALFCRNGTSVTLDLFVNQEDSEPYTRIELNAETNKTGDIWHVFVPGVKAGALYMYQVDGPFDLSKGFRYNKKQFLFDPYAKAITAESVFKNIPKSYRTPVDKTDIELFDNSELKIFPKCVVVDDKAFDWEGDKAINRPLKDCIIYETHLKGFTSSPSSGVQHPGTYKGFIEKIPYLKELGINSVELMPIHEFDEFENNNINPRTGERMKNYWGYSTVAFFAPKASYASDKRPGAVVNEFKTLVKELHSNGIEVILDVVFNHTAEGNEHGYSMSFRGIDNAIYYSLVDTHKEYYLNFSGCGNTVNCNQPVVRNMIIDCLRYWVMEYHIDGFRFDLASILTRSQEGAILNFPPLTNQISEDPVLHNTKIIAEPWDAGGAYQLGGFPGGRWAEWNDRYRDDIRRFWRGDDHISTGAATRISGSSDLFTISGRTPAHSINYITAHDGFTLNDLVSYNGKHNDQNGEDNRDGSDSNWSYNNGYEGLTANPLIERNRNRQIRNFILTLLISQGTPMMLCGDEFRRTQEGNNNAYCQDNEISWVNWENAQKNSDLLEFTKRAIKLRKDHPVFHRDTFFLGERTDNLVKDIRWYNADGSQPDWNQLSRFLAFTLGGVCVTKEDGSPDNNFYIAANSDRTDVVVKLPTLEEGKDWYLLADTSLEKEDSLKKEDEAEQLRSQGRYVVPAGSLIILIAK